MMKLPKLSNFFPVNETMADLYGGWLEGPFFKIIFNQGLMNDQIDSANYFLEQNGFETVISEDDFKDNLEIELDLITFSFKTLGGNMLLLIYEQPLMSKPMDSLVEFIKLFRDERDWKQFHTSKNLSMAISAEAGELLDHFLWDRSNDINQDKISNEIADILMYLILLSNELNIDIIDSVINKIKQNAEKYPIDKSKGTARKYNKL